MVVAESASTPVSTRVCSGETTKIVERAFYGFNESNSCYHTIYVTGHRITISIGHDSAKFRVSQVFGELEYVGGHRSADTRKHSE